MLTVRGFEHLVTEALQCLDDVTAHVDVVFDYQHAFVRSGTTGFTLHLFLDRRHTDEPAQIDFDRRALTHLTVIIHVTARLPDKPIHLAQSEPGALARLLCREERLKRP